MQETFGATLPFFALILCGYVARWLGVMGDGSAKVINNFVLYFALPALLVRTLAGLPISTLLAPDFLIAWTAVGAALFALVVHLSFSSDFPYSVLADRQLPVQFGSPDCIRPVAISSLKSLSR